MVRHACSVGLVVLAGCAAPPLGIGRGAHRDVTDSAISMSAGIGVTPDREVAQVDASFAHRYSKRFALEYGGALTQVGVARESDTLIGIGALPYVRPRWTFGRASLAVAASGFMASGGEGGAVGGFADVQLGIGGAHYSIYAGAYGLGYFEALGPSLGATQARLGAEWLFSTSAGRFGFAIEAFAGLDAMRPTEEPMSTTSRFLGAGLKLRYERR
jgi:hypothetical protein